jgi:hypothetical protein
MEMGWALIGADLLPFNSRKLTAVNRANLAAFL